MKVDPDGDTLWVKRYGGPNFEEFHDVLYLDRHYYCVGYTRSWVNESATKPNTTITRGDIFLVKVDLSGNLVWAKNFGSLTGSSSTGDETGYRIIAAQGGGVIISARLNLNTNFDQDACILWVQTDGTVRWAYRYDFTAKDVANEMLLDIYSVGDFKYVTAGWYDWHTTWTDEKGLALSIDQDGALLWSKKLVLTGMNFSSHYNGYFDYKTGHVLTADRLYLTSSSIREPQVTRINASNGSIPSGGGIKQVLRMHYGSAGSSGNIHHGYVFPEGDGASNMLLSMIKAVSPAGSTTIPSVIAKVDADLNFQWSVEVGVQGVLTHLVDMVACDDNSIIAVGMMQSSAGNKNVVIARIQDTTSIGELDCINVNTVSNSSLTASSSDLSMVRVNLNNDTCGTACFADDDFISGVDVNDVTFTITECGSTQPLMFAMSDHALVTFCSDANCDSDANVSFGVKPAELFFEIRDETGEFVFLRVYNETQQLEAGIKYDELGMKPGTYRWELQATYVDEPQMEMKFGEFVVD